MAQGPFGGDEEVERREDMMATDQEIRAALESGMTQRAVMSSMACGRHRISRIASTMPETSTTAEIAVQPATGGFSLAGRNLMAKKPTDVWGPRFNALTVDKGYMPDVLSKQWGCSLNTIRDRARAAGAIRYTEMDGQYIEVIVNPKTRGGK